MRLLLVLACLSHNAYADADVENREKDIVEQSVGRREKLQALSSLLFTTFPILQPRTWSTPYYTPYNARGAIATTNRYRQPFRSWGRSYGMARRGYPFYGGYGRGYYDKGYYGMGGRGYYSGMGGRGYYDRGYSSMGGRGYYSDYHDAGYGNRYYGGYGGYGRGYYGGYGNRDYGGYGGYGNRYYGGYGNSYGGYGNRYYGHWADEY